jgi:hypothetical protein
MTNSRGPLPAPEFTTEELTLWLSSPELALWPSHMTMDALMRHAGAAITAAEGALEHQTAKITHVRDWIEENRPINCSIGFAEDGSAGDDAGTILRMLDPDFDPAIIAATPTA